MTNLASEQFHAHLDQCKRCAGQPFNLCPIGAQLLGTAAASLSTNAGKLTFDRWVVEVTRHELHELPISLHGYLHTAFLQGVSVSDAREAHAEQRRRGR